MEQNSDKRRGRRRDSNTSADQDSLPTAETAIAEEGHADTPTVSIPSDQPSESANLLERVNWVRAHLPASIAKDKEISVAGAKYAVVTHENINQFLRPLLAKAGLIDYASLWEAQVVETGMENQNSGRKVLHYRGKYEYVVVSAFNPGQSLAVNVEGWGEDGGDKGPGKAHTYAIKTGRKQMFSIAAGDAEEERTDDLRDAVGRPQAELISPLQLDELLKTADDLFGDDSDKALKALCESQAFRVPEVKQILAKHFESAIMLLKRWKASKEKKQASDDVPMA